MTLSDVIVIRGAPGSGKSEAAKCLATRICTGVRIEVDALRAMIIGVDWTNQSQHVNVLSLATNLIVGFLGLGNRPVIVIDTFSGNKLSAFLEELWTLRPEVQVSLFALVPNRAVHRSRIERRPDNQFKDLAVCEMLNVDTTRHLQLNERVIDNSELTPNETVDVILGRRSRIYVKMEPPPE